MAKECIQKGFEYLVISDHSKTAVYANGLTEERIREQHRYIDELNTKLAPFKIFKSIESDILNDGSLDYPDDVLATFDLVIASVHSNLKMSEEKAMARLIKAITSQRRRLHRAAALYLEKTENYALLAHHWRVAGERIRWLVCLEKAGDEAVARGVNHEAVSFFDQALKLDERAGDDDLRRAHWHGQLGDAWYGLGKLGKSRYHLDEALRLLGKPLPRSHLGWALRGLYEIAVQCVLLIVGRRLLRSSPDAEPRVRDASRLMNIVSEQFYFAVDIQKMVVCLLSTINLAERTGAPETASPAYGTLGYVAGIGRLHALSRLYFHRGQRGRDARSYVNTAVGLALYHLAFGRWTACLAALEDGRARAEAVGDMFGVGLCLNVLGDARHLMGALQQATSTYEELVANALARLNTQHEVWGLSGCAETLFTQGRIGEANERLRECAAVMPLIADSDRLSAFRHEGVKAAIRMRLDDAAGAAASLDEALRLYRADPTPCTRHIGL